MKVSEKWLREWVNPSVGTDELAEQLTMLGLEVDSIELAAPRFDGVVVARVSSVQAHPDATKLKVCEVHYGEDFTVEVVCGAPNVQAGICVPLATIGAKLPGGYKIKKSKLRGVESHGMLCSESELGLAQSSDGLMILPKDAPIGSQLYDFLDLGDPIFDVDLTPNRADCFSIRGVAREIGVQNSCDLSVSDYPTAPITIDDVIPVELTKNSGCSRYVGRIIRGIDPDAKTPLWLKERLRRSGIRSVSPAVDVTNLVMLELGQPMHAFDLDKIQDQIIVRKANDTESLIVLDGTEVSLSNDTIVITDSSGPIAMGGIMGGQNSAINDKTVSIMLEAACFLPKDIIGKSRQYSLYTDSSHRFERGVDPNLQSEAMELATRLLIDIIGGSAGPVFETVDESILRTPSKVLLRRSRITEILGISFPDERIEEILSRLEVRWQPCNEGWHVVAPSFRYDLNIEEDFIEELVRIYGYDKLPRTSPALQPVINAEKAQRGDEKTILNCLVSQGYSEVITFSFVDKSLQEKIYREPPLELANPISSDLSVMRIGLWPGLIDTLVKNLNRQQNQIKFFECGLKFVLQDNELSQKKVLGGIVSGLTAPQLWCQDKREVDFFDLKADIERLFTLSGSSEFSFEQGQHEALHPGQTAQIKKLGKPIGWIGRIHPALESELSLGQSALLFEIDFDALSKKKASDYENISRFPSIRRDISIIVSEAVSYRSIQTSIRSVAPDFLNEIVLFDVFQDERIGIDHKSFALGLLFQAASHTLTDEEVEEAIEVILSSLNIQYGAKLRE